MTERAFEPKQGRIRDNAGRTNLTTARRVLTQAGRAGAGIVRQRGHIARDARWRGTAPGLFARAGMMAGSRRVIVRARYSRQIGGDLGAAKAHLRYIQRDGITCDGGPGQLYDAVSDQADGNAFLERSERDPLHLSRCAVRWLSVWWDPSVSRGQSIADAARTRVNAHPRAGDRIDLNMPPTRPITQKWIRRRQKTSKGGSRERGPRRIRFDAEGIGRPPLEARSATGRWR